MELVVGAFNKQEVEKIRRVFRGMRVLQIDEDVSKKAVELITSYSKSHNLLIPDALSQQQRSCLIFLSSHGTFPIPDIHLVKES